MLPTLSYYAKGKLLITGEYAVLDGALALAIPTKKGQLLEVFPSKDLQLNWSSFDADGALWFDCLFSPELEILSTSNTEKALTLQNILRLAIALNSSFKKELSGKTVKTKLEFDRNWGLGSSSTLLHLIGQWAQINPYALLKTTFGGSGYDIACADANGPITYQITPFGVEVKQVSFQPDLLNDFFFIYLGQKQVSKNEIAKFGDLKINREELASKISHITERLITSFDTTAISNLLTKHEELLSKTLGYPMVKNERFKGIEGTFKSLGAWGGDFVLYIGKETELQKIKSLGYHTIVPWKVMLNL